MSDNLPVPSGPIPTTVHSLSPEIIGQLVQNQARELDLRAADLTLQQQKDTNAFTYAREALQAQKEDRKDSRIHRCRMRDRWYIFIAAMAFLAAALIAYSLFSGHEAFALELLKFIAYVSIGGIGGYGVARAKDAKRASSSDSEEHAG